MAKVVYNDGFGGFSLSAAAIDRYWELKGEARPEHWSDKGVDRSDPVLVRVVEELRRKANGAYARLMVRELKDGTLYRIEEYDGAESVVARDEYEWSVA